MKDLGLVFMYEKISEKQFSDPVTYICKPEELL